MRAIEPLNERILIQVPRLDGLQLNLAFDIPPDEPVGEQFRATIPT